MHYYEWFWQNEAIRGYLFPELIIRDLGIINTHMVWRPMALPESGSWEMWKDMVTNEHLAKCVKVCLSDIRFAKSQNGMETQQCKCCLSISLQFRIIGVWKHIKIAYGVIIETTNYTVMCYSRRKKWSRMGIWKKNTRGKYKVRNMWLM